MTSSYSLSPDLELGLCATATRVTADAMDQERQRTSEALRPNFDGTEKAVLCNLDNLPSRLARDSARHTRAELPNEVWAMIWQDLPLLDRLDVTHVCHYWRNIALASPRVWSALDYRFFQHRSSCKCKECKSKTPKRVRSSPRIFSMILPRSSRLPLSIRIKNSDNDCGRQLFAAVKVLASLLRPHASRISRLDVFVSIATVLPDLVEGVGSFPTLVSLAAGTCVTWESITMPLASERFDAPALRYLSLVGNWCNEHNTTFHFPAVQTLRVTHESRVGVEPLLDACPNVSSLDVWWFVDFALETDTAENEAFRIRVSRIRRVALLNVCSMGFQWVRSLYDCSDRADYSYAFERKPAEGCISIFSDVGAATDLVVSCAESQEDDSYNALIVATSPTQRRALEFSSREAKHLSTIWSRTFDGSQLKHIECHWSLWFLIAAAMPSLPALEILRFTVCNDCMDERWPIIDLKPACGEQFPSLRRVILQGERRHIPQRDSPYCIVTSDWWNSVVESIKIEVSSVPIEFQNIGMDVDLTDWYEARLTSREDDFGTMLGTAL
ncbi:hypothetical protein EXIGLDRAFT_727581 [Exidia glandulosa HHB12029]|uniref:F-box domain-containing protein n=1 Tax=Exidia glandulosa HHB12029 TaxID=1314781 RepID=A0A165DBE2_EXIGL|nr:hypothetical protein EXIGLDRAFT_727581 [Exidia glandulosa HHB12029]